MRPGPPHPQCSDRERHRRRTARREHGCRGGWRGGATGRTLPVSRKSDRSPHNFVRLERPRYAQCLEIKYLAISKCLSGPDVHMSEFRFMSPSRRIFVSMPANKWLSRPENRLKWAIVQRVEDLGFHAEIFHDPRTSDAASEGSISSGLAWTADHVTDIMRRCVGAVIIGLPRWNLYGADGGAVKFVSEFCHYEGAVGRAYQLPTLLLAQQDVSRRVVFDYSFAHMAEMPTDCKPAWLNTPDFTAPFETWRRQLNARRDVFLGYCGSSTAVAQGVRRRLSNYGVTVLDWQIDFKPGRNILDEIEEASARCGAGIFVFTRDDDVVTPSLQSQAVPRDNVVFEAGYFIRAKGKDRVLIIREAGAKMPADLGGDIYATLTDRTKLNPLTKILRRFVDTL
jgi:hypothetical protein